MTQKKTAPGAGHSEGGSRVHLNRLVDDSGAILPQEIQTPLSKVPPRGHSHQFLTFWLQRHALGKELALQHRAGVLVDRHPTCPIRIKRRVDRITVRLDHIQHLLRNPLRAAAALDRVEMRA